MKTSSTRPEQPQPTDSSSTDEQQRRAERRRELVFIICLLTFIVLAGGLVMAVLGKVMAGKPELAPGALAIGMLHGMTRGRHE